MGGINVLGGLNINPEMLKTKNIHQENIKKSKKLYQLKGRRRVRSFQVELSGKSLNKGDVFILDTGDKIFQWNGSECNRMERTKGKDITTRLNRQRGSKAEIIILDEGDNDEPKMFQFWKELGGKIEVTPSQNGGDDLEIENQIDNRMKFYRIREDGELELIEGKLVIEMLDTNFCFILDCYSEFFIWIGKTSPKEMRNIAIIKGEELFHKNERPSWTEIIKCPEGGESVFFCEKFSNWPDGATLGPQKIISNIAQSKKQEKIDVLKMYNTESPIIQEDFKIPNDGKIEIWKIKESIKEEVPLEQYGQFWSGHSYIILYTFGVNESQSSIVFFWQGRDCPKNEKGTSAGLAMELAKKMRGATQIYISQNKESSKFLEIFKGKMIIHKGKQKDKKNDICLYHIKGSKENDTSTIEIEPNSFFLNSNDVFILLSEKENYIWIGKQSNEFERTISNEICSILNNQKKIQIIQEDSECNEFWSLLGGKKNILSEYKIKKGWEPKFFQFSNASGMVTAEAIFHFTQDDLQSESVILLDTFYQIYLWIGNKSRENEKKIAMETALEYIKIIKDKRQLNIQVVNILEGNEPIDFVRYFHGWDKLNKVKIFQKIIKLIFLECSNI